MNLPRLVTRLAVGATAAVLATATLGVPSASAAGKSKPLGTRSLAQVLTKDTSGFDRNSRDFDVLTAAVLAVLDAKPKSPVGVLTDGSARLTAFVPTDAAFRTLVADITNKRRLPTEQQAFTAVAGLGINTVENVLLYHVVPGATIDRRAALKSDGAALTTALGPAVKVDVKRYWFFKQVRLIDADRSDRNPRVVRYDINKGNRQIAHAIDRVLRPINLP
jgi:uncharacterized surface protein with fasciclin (FAS1) repeats